MTDFATSALLLQVQRSIFNIFPISLSLTHYLSLSDFLLSQASTTSSLSLSLSRRNSPRRWLSYNTVNAWNCARLFKVCVYVCESVNACENVCLRGMREGEREERNYQQRAFKLVRTVLQLSKRGLASILRRKLLSALSLSHSFNSSLSTLALSLSLSLFNIPLFERPRTKLGAKRTRNCRKWDPVSERSIS